MRKSVFIFGVAIFAFIGCKNDVKKEVTVQDELETVESTIDEHNSQNSLDWAGLYEGMIPCADCEGIKVFLELNQDKTYTLTQTYLGKPEKDNEIEKSGDFRWDDSGSQITLKDGADEMHYKVGENQLLMLDTEGNIIDGKISDLYILKKITD